MITLEKINFKKINSFLDEINNNLIYYCPDYLKFLEIILKDSKIFYIVYQNKKKILAIMPVSISSVENKYQIINSLPFFGGHGGIIIEDVNKIEKRKIQSRILSFLNKTLINKKTLSTIIIENPFFKINNEIYQKNGFYEEDNRFSQFKILPNSNKIDETKNLLFESFHTKTRNSIRKGFKLNPKIYETNKACDIKWIYKIHKSSISRLNGKNKTLFEFNELLKIFPPPKNSRIFIAEINGVKISGLILILYKNSVEYFTPVIHEDYKSSQLLSALIFHAMTKLTVEGYKLWNWGGTWKSQTGVFRFKQRFGSDCKEYRYLSKKNFEALGETSPLTLKKYYNHYYAYNFDLK